MTTYLNNRQNTRSFLSNKKSLVVTFFFFLCSLTSMAQVPSEVPIYGVFTLQPGTYSIDGASPAGPGNSTTFGSLLSFKLGIFRENYYAESTTDVPSAWLIGWLMDGFGNSPSSYNITMNNLDNTLLNSNLQGGDYDLVFSKANILGVSQSFKVYDDFMLGYHLGWDGISSGVINKDREVVGLEGALNLNYWNFAPVVAYQNEKIRVEAKYLFNRAKTIDKGREIRVTGDYFIMNKEETLGVSIGAFVNTLNISTNDQRPNVGEVSLFAAGIRLSILYPSLWSLL